MNIRPHRDYARPEFPEVHTVRMEIQLARLPFPATNPMARIGGQYKIMAETLDMIISSSPDHAKELALEMITHGLESIVRSTEDQIRKDWNMETRSEKSRREHEERRRAATARMFAGDYSQAMAERSKVILYGRTPAETEDYPLGEAPPL